MSGDHRAARRAGLVLGLACLTCSCGEAEPVPVAPVPTARTGSALPDPAPAASTPTASVRTDPSALRTRWDAIVETQDYERVLAECESELRRDPESLVALEFRARALDWLGRTEEARRAYATLLEKEPRSASVWESLGLMELRYGSFDAAAAALRRVTELDPESFEGWTQLASALTAVGNHDAAVAAIERARAAKLDEGWCLLRLASIAWEAGDAPTAAARIAEAEQAGTDEENVRYVRRMVTVESTVSPEDRARSDPAKPWRTRCGIFDVETTIAPELPEQVRLVLDRASAELPALLSLGGADVRIDIVLSRTWHEHDALWRAERPGQPSGTGSFSGASSPGRVRVFVSWDLFDFDHVVLHESAKALVALRWPRAAPWLVHGLASQAETISRGSDSGAGPPHVQRLDAARADGRMLAWREVTTLGEDRFTGRDGERAHAQAWLLVDWLLHGKDAPGPGAITSLLAADPAKPDSALESAVDRPWDAISTSLDAHMNVLLAAPK